MKDEVRVKEYAGITKNRVLIDFERRFVNENPIYNQELLIRVTSCRGLPRAYAGEKRVCSI